MSGSTELFNDIEPVHPAFRQRRQGRRHRLYPDRDRQAQRRRPAGLARPDPRTYLRIQDRPHRRTAAVEHRAGRKSRRRRLFTQGRSDRTLTDQPQVTICLHPSESGAGFRASSTPLPAPTERHAPVPLPYPPQSRTLRCGLPAAAFRIPLPDLNLRLPPRSYSVPSGGSP